MRPNSDPRLIDPARSGRHTEAGRAHRLPSTGLFPGPMIPDTRKYRLGIWGPVVISAMAMILVAAASEHDANRDRLRAMPPEERGRVLSNLRKFDLELSPEQQSAVRELDRRLSELPPEERGEYLS